jgi:hypothetical protein
MTRSPPGYRECFFVIGEADAIVNRGLLMYKILILGMIVALLLKLVSLRKAKRAAMAGALCHGCVHVHKVKGSRKMLLFCNFGSELRAIKFAVRECTGFCSSTAPAPAPVRVTGFVRVKELSNEEAFPATVIHISR